MYSGILVSIFSNLVSILIVVLGLSGYCNGYQATVAVVYNICGLLIQKDQPVGLYTQ